MCYGPRHQCFNVTCHYYIRQVSQQNALVFLRVMTIGLCRFYHVEHRRGRFYTSLLISEEKMLRAILMIITTCSALNFDIGRRDRGSTIAVSQCVLEKTARYRRSSHDVHLRIVSGLSTRKAISTKAGPCLDVLINAPVTQEFISFALLHLKVTLNLSA